jgi:FkbM family methyltransferase
MSIIRGFAKWLVVLILGRESSPRLILRGLASGYRICLSPAENLGCLLGTTEPHLQRIIRKYVSPGQTVYDIGANIGYVTLSLAKCVGLHGRVFDFEPIPKNIEFLRRTLEANRLTTVELLEAAASNASGDAVIRMTEKLSTPSLVWHHKNPAARELIIKTVVIDQLVEIGEIPRPSFVKIDVEGAEGLVLQGMRNTILAAKPVVFIECSEIGRQISWDLLRESGYRCQSAITRQWIDAFENYVHSDFLWLPPEHTA